jgi:hypothetical protein
MIQRAIAAIGEEPVANALVALGEAYPDIVVTNAARLLNALFLIYTEDANRPGFDPDLFIQALGSVRPTATWTDFAEDAQRASPALSRREAHAAAMMEVYDALRAETRAAA